MKFSHKTAELHSLCINRKASEICILWDDIISIRTWDQKMLAIKFP